MIKIALLPKQSTQITARESNLLITYGNISRYSVEVDSARFETFLLNKISKTSALCFLSINSIVTHEL